MANESGDLKHHWDSVWHGRAPQRYTMPTLELHPLLKRLLPSGPTVSFLEIGCVPGNHMVYFAKEFGYRVSGVDYSDEIELARATCRLNGVESAIWHADVFSIQFPEQFDVVFSTGFLEHFPDWERAVDVHLRWIADNGYLVAAVPNVHGIHKFLFRRLHPANYAVHCLDILERPQSLRRYIEKTCTILYFGYWTTWRAFYRLPLVLDIPSRLLRKVLQWTGLANIPNRTFSPYLWVVAKKNMHQDTRDAFIVQALMPK